MELTGSFQIAVAYLVTSLNKYAAIMKAMAVPSTVGDSKADNRTGVGLIVIEVA